MQKFDPKTNLVWIDLEMTGVNSEFDRILQIGVVVTNDQLEIIDEGFELIVHQPEDVLLKANEFVKVNLADILRKSKESEISELEAESKVMSKIADFVFEKSSPLCGNSIWQDRRFIAKYMPKLDQYLNYRNIDISTIKELYKRWKPEGKVFEKKKGHTALEDIKESIAELVYYREIGFIG